MISTLLISNRSRLVNTADIKLLFALFFSLSSIHVKQCFGQAKDTNLHATNIYYWKNRKPFSDYWQQDVHYKITAVVNEKTDVISGQEELTYWNNSPDELNFVYFHLYENAFQPESYMDKLTNANNVYPKYGHYEKQQLGTVIHKLTVNNNEVKTELDNTILKVYLDKPLKSGESVVFSIVFNTYFEAQSTVRRRMKMFNAYGYKHYDGVHWYPRISVYDRKFGWDTEQHLEKEFYGDFGTYDVDITLANNFVVEATGILTNKEEVLPETLRSKLDIKNFKDKPLESPPSVIIPYDSTKRKTWRYHAENVHDFAFTADPTYRIGEVNWNGIQIIAMAQEPHAAGWQNAAEYTANVIRVYSEDFGKYGYPKMVVCDARDGMEYPMLTLDGGLDPEYRDLIAHEVGHNWFYGMVGSNETYRAMLDEGFTQFISTWAYEKIDGKYRLSLPPYSRYLKKFMHYKELIRDGEVYNGYMADAIKGEEMPLNTHSAMFNGALRHGGGYRQVYYKTAAVLYNLQYVLGDELFQKAMQHYFEQWKFCHPYVEDFRTSVINYTKVDLNWFFDQWFETTKTVDYSIKCIRKGKEKNDYTIRFKRYGMQMPLDFTVKAKNGSVYNYHIPNNWFVKSTPATVLPKWIGWDILQPTYDAHVTIPSGIKEVIIDTTQRLADVNMLNNSTKCAVNFDLDTKVPRLFDWKHYTLLARPEIWYNGYDGFKFGIHANGNFVNYKHIFDATLWYNSALAQNYLDEMGVAPLRPRLLSYRFNYKTATDKLMPYSSINLGAKFLDGLQAYTLGMEKSSKSKRNRYYIGIKAMYRADVTDLYYLLYPKEWQVEKWNNTITVGLQHLYAYRLGTGDINFSLRSTTLYSDYDYALANLTVINKNRLWKFNFNTRIVFQYGTGSNWAPESQLYLAGANPEELMDNKYTRAHGFFNPSWAGFGANVNHFQKGGGLGLRGYAGYLVPEVVGTAILFTYKGTTGTAINAELEFDRLFKWGVPRFVYRNYNLYKFIYNIRNTFKVNLYLFADAGMLNYNYIKTKEITFADARIDAGIGTALTIKRFGPLQGINPLTVRFDMPLFLNRIPNTETDNFKFRWIIGINRAF